MMTKALIKSSDKSSALRVEIGGRLLVTFDGMERNLWSTLIGIDHGNYLIIRSPKIEGIDSRIREGSKINITYFIAGTVYGFETTIMHYITSPMSLIFIDYPGKIKRIELRKLHRVDCYIPGRLGFGGQEYSGAIMDLNTGGGRFSMVCAETGQLPNLVVGDHVTLRVVIPGSEICRVLHARAKNILRDTNKINMGLQFINLDNYALSEIQSFIRGIIDFAHFPK